MSEQLPTNYLLLNQSLNKNISIVVAIDGLDLLSNTPIGTKIRYGDAGLFYGTPLSDGTTPVYGGLRPLTSVRDILSLDYSSLTLSQRLEPEQGRGSVSTISLAFIDLNQYMTQVVSPGVLIPDIMGALTTVNLGFRELSYPEDFFTVFRGKVSAVNSKPGLMMLQFSDANIARRQTVFTIAKTQLTMSIGSGDTTINVASNGDFFQHILGPDGSYDPAIRLFMQIEDEWIEYGPTASVPGGIFGTNQFIGVTRGARGTTPAAHDAGTDVQDAVQIAEECLPIALKVMLSGWNGPFKTDVPVQAIVRTGDVTLGDQPGAIVLPSKVDAKRDYGLTTGDYVTISGDTNALNDVTGFIVKFGDLFDEPNRLIYINQTLFPTSPSPALLSFRSQYDTYPTNCGCQMDPSEVDVDQHNFLTTTFFGQLEYQYSFFITQETSGKTFIESEIYLPIACYSVTKRGKVSVNLTTPPLGGTNLQFINFDNVIDPQNITVERALNNRKFFNDIVYNFDARDDGTFASVEHTIDTDSLNIIGINSTLPISSMGARSILGFESIIARNSHFLLQRYKMGATIVTLKVNWTVGSQIDAGDTVALVDAGQLQIANFATGQRNFGVQLAEVVDRSLDLKTGITTLKLINGLGADVTDRFATISPSSHTDVGSTTNSIVIKDSFGAIFPGDEPRKWRDYVGQKILVHSFDYSVAEIVTLTGLNPGNNYILSVSPALSFTPPADYVIDIPDYPTSTDPYENQLYKAIHAFLDPTVTVVSGTSDTEFTVSVPDSSKFFADCIIRVHDYDYNFDSGDATVLSVDTGTGVIVTKTSLGFTPAAGQFVDLIGFADHGGAYRWI